MAAQNTDKLRKGKSLFSTNLASGIDDNDTTATLNSVSGLATDTAVQLTFDRVDTQGESLGSLVERVLGVVSGGNTVIDMLRGLDGTSAQPHDTGAVVESIWDADTWNDMIDWALTQHNQDGTHSAITGTTLSLSSTLAVTGVATFSSNIKINDSSTAIIDSSSNELIKFAKTASAVNEITVTNASTGNNPSIGATGGDSNISLSIFGKGTGVVNIFSPKFTLGSDATGDIWYRNSSGNLQRLGVGSDGDVLTLASGVPSWAAPSSSTAGKLQSFQSSDSITNSSNNTTTFSEACSVTFTPSAVADCMVIGTLNWYAGTANDQAKMRIALDGSVLGSDPGGYTDFPTASKATSVTTVEFKSSLSAASHKFEVQYARNVGSGAININLAMIRVVVWTH